MARMTALLAVTALALVGCGGSGGGSGAGQAAGASVDGAKILDFALPDTTGELIRGGDYRGKALALWFWAPW